MSDFNLKNRRTLITGGGSGLGFAIAKKFKEAGAEVIIVGRNKEKLDSAAEILGEGVYPWTFDLSKTSEIPEMARKIEKEIGSIDILVNCAGNHLKKPIQDTSDEDFSDVIQIHLTSVFVLIREFSKGMIARKDGAIILISSMTAIIGMGKVSAYSAAKSALKGLMYNLVAEFAPFNVRINTIAPGWIETPMLSKAIDRDPERKQKILNRIPSNAFGKPKDIANACVFLSSKAGKYVQGIFLPVDGGAAIGF
jgi:NAD(P)-dependent dehydrogenase (short-subunit alcohol dehydrogenase family)